MVSFPTAAPAAPVPGLRDVRLANGVRLRYARQGPATGPALILLHGYSDSSFSFSRVMPLLPPYLRVIAPDFRGHGDSDRPEHGYAVDDLAADIVQMMDALNVPAATIAGHSLGTYVARRVYAAAPARVSRLVLLSGGFHSNTPLVRELKSAVDALGDPVDEAFVREFQMSTINLPVPDDFMRAVIANSRRMPLRVWKAIIQALVDFKPSETRPPVRTLVLGGRKDAIFSVGEQTELSRAYPNAELHLVDLVGHTLHWEQPSVFVSALARFGV